MRSAKEPLLGPSRPSLVYCRPGYATRQVSFQPGNVLLLTVGHHGNEPCGVVAFNELIEEGFLRQEEGTWPWPWDILRVELANPKALEAGKRFLDINLNRIYTESDLRLSVSPSCVSYEHTLIGRLMLAVRECTEHLDIHSTSAATPPFAFHMGGSEAASFAASFPVAYTLDDRSEGARGTGIAYAAQVGVKRAVLVECGQHDSPQSVQVAKAAIRRFVSGNPDQGLRAESIPIPLRIKDAALVRKGFRWKSAKVEAFGRFEEGEVVAEDEDGEIRCPFPEGALLVMPTQLPVEGEEAWLWGLPL